MLRNSKVSWGSMRRLENRETQGTHHFETKGSVYHEENKVCDLSNVDHAVEVGIALDKGDSPLLACDDRNGTLCFVERLLGVPTDQTLQQSGFPNTRWSYNGDDDRRGILVGGAVDERDMEASLVFLSCSSSLPIRLSTRFWSKGLCIEALVLSLALSLVLGSSVRLVRAVVHRGR